MTKRLLNIWITACIALLLFGLDARGGEEVKKTGVLNATLHGQRSFLISGSKNINGKIRLFSRQSDAVVINFEKTAVTTSKAESERFLELIDFRLDVTDDQAICEILSPSHSPWEGSNYSVNFELLIEIPEKMDILAKGVFIDFEIEGPFQGVDLNASFSSVDIRRIYGPVKVSTSFGDVSVEAVKGETRIETDNGKISARNIIVPSGYAVFQASNSPISLSDIRGPVEAYTSYSAIDVNKIEATYEPVVLKTTYGPVNIVNATGEIICETSYAPISITTSKIKHGRSKIETSHAPITLQFDEISDCELLINNDFNNVNLSLPTDISAKFIVSVGNGGRIHTKNLNLRPTVLDLTSLEAYVGEGDSRIEVAVDGIGNVNIDGR